MRTRLVVWGTNAEDQKVLLAVALQAEENKIDIWAIPEKSCSEDYYNLVMTQWREGKDLNFPEGTVHRTTELTMSDSILPEDLKVERGDMIQRAQMEWHFVVLSSKLYRNFKNDLEELSDKIKRLEVYDQNLWDDLKELWSNVQKHIMDRNLFRDHSDSLRQKSDAMFEELKKLRSALKSELNQKSKVLVDGLKSKIAEIEKKITEGAALKPLFDDMIKIQTEFKTMSLNRDDRSSLMSKIDEVFKGIRAKRESSKPGGQRGDANPANRNQSRYEGLIQAITKIEQAIARDHTDISFENRRIESSTGQLEAQIRVAKIKMIEERIKFKQEKLDELLKVKASLEKANDNAKKREEKDARRNEQRQKVKEEEEKIKAKIQENIQQQHETLSNEEEKLIKAAEEIKTSKSKAKNKTGQAAPDSIESIPSLSVEQTPMSNTSEENPTVEEDKPTSNEEE
ncbi:MAG: hypothetical protein IPP06_00485 [Saprospiraceae bacterium]|nr:hypothetical protein [Candidatus Vicinibacter affinis]